MNPCVDLLFPATDELERCPVCGHEWADRGPAHFTDCRYFCLDDERDEDRSSGTWHRVLLSLPEQRSV